MCWVFFLRLLTAKEKSVSLIRKNQVEGEEGPFVKMYFLRKVAHLSLWWLVPTYPSPTCVYTFRLHIPSYLVFLFQHSMQLTTDASAQFFQPSNGETIMQQNASLAMWRCNGGRTKLIWRGEHIDEAFPCFQLALFILCDLVTAKYDWLHGNITGVQKKSSLKKKDCFKCKQLLFRATKRWKNRIYILEEVQISISIVSREHF